MAVTATEWRIRRAAGAIRARDAHDARRDIEAALKHGVPRRRLWLAALTEARRGEIGDACDALIAWIDLRHRCEWCEGWYRPTRSDSATCSPACRQAVCQARATDPVNDPPTRPDTWCATRAEATGYGLVTGVQARRHAARVRAAAAAEGAT